MRGPWSTLALVAVAAGLGAYIYFVDSKRPDTEAKEKVFAVAADAVEELRVVSKGDTSVLKKADGAWKLVEPVATDADANELTALVNSLTSLEINREVDPNATDLAQYGLSTPKADITFTAKGGVTGRLRLGEMTPTGSDLYAVKGDESRVFLLSTFVETNLAKSAFELRDKRVLRFERDKVDGLDITNGTATAGLTRANSEWRVAPAGARGDYGSIEGLLTRLSSAMMSAIETTDVSDLKKYGLDKPATTVVVKAGSATATLAVGTSADGKAFARDLSRAMVFTIDGTLATDLQKSADEYRKKEVFDLRMFSVKEIVLTRETDVITFRKKAGTGDTPVDTWTVTGPGGAATREVKSGLVEEAVTKLTGLRATSFVAAAPTAGTTPFMKVSAQFDENKKEEASFARTDTDVVVVRPDEGGAMRIEVTAVEDALKAFDAVLAPPEPPAPAAATPSPAPGTAKPEQP